MINTLLKIKDSLLADLSLGALFNRNPGPFPANFAYFSLFFLLFWLFFALIWRFRTKNKDIFAKKIARRFFRLSWAMGIIGLVLWIFRQLNAAYLSSRFIILLWIVVLLIWLGIWLNYCFRIAPKRRRQLAQEVAKKAYLP